MIFKTDLNKLLLLGNKTIHIFFKDKIVNFIPPTLELLYSYNFSELKTVLDTDYTTIDLHIIVENQYEFFLAFLKISDHRDIIMENFNKIFPNIIYSKNQLFCDDLPITNDEFLVLRDFLKVTCAEQDLSTILPEAQVEQEEEKPKGKFAELFNKLQDNEEKLKKMKEKNKKGSSGNITIDQIVVAIIYEFPSLKIEDVFQMNLFSILEMWKYVSKVIDTKIQITAAGNGLVKNFTYFIN